MTEQLDLFDLTPQRPQRKIKLISLGRGSAGLPTGFPCRPAVPHASWATPDGRWHIEANDWRNGKWCVFDMTDPEQRAEQHRYLQRRYYDPEVPYTLHPIPGEAGTVVKTLDEAKELIAEAIA